MLTVHYRAEPARERTSQTKSREDWASEEAWVADADGKAWIIKWRIDGGPMSFFRLHATGLGLKRAVRRGDDESKGLGDKKIAKEDRREVEDVRYRTEESRRKW
ncbi:uncharacterized protein PGTG_17038 [Puccinia graminis f. sp. tritici CRL 75-36-700-3]|uniref:Uncharacterized protein n=1 Tax=Puccinia graminis f. sp. tritici (strain CRL 75-36-700-3 / race SCCL) TaxID=418459 RepID=E3L2S3_PUCGT|nr:uncharacterized protein PGTG_17038 [Puccinia graminis f. sp. tritici CRL 75-36-700-3]EFP90839.1 hypothetical protein PGTG_17038 [Puccinia graminis f. sp. tritici CRL 75-36-700-3]